MIDFKLDLRHIVINFKGLILLRIKRGQSEPITNQTQLTIINILIENGSQNHLN